MGMDFETINRGVYHLMVLATSAIVSVSPISTIQAASPALPLNNDIVIQKNTDSGPDLNILDENANGQLKLVGADLGYTQSYMVASAEAKVSDKPVGPQLPEPTPTPTPSPKILAAEATESGSIKSNMKPEEKKTEVLSLNADLLFEMANNHRVKIGLSPFEKDDRICKIAQDRGPALQNEIFGSGRMHSGFYALNLPYWATENIAGYNTEEQTFGFWVTDRIHKEAIEGDYKYSCVACYGNFCSQIFTNFAPK